MLIYNFSCAFWFEDDLHYINRVSAFRVSIYTEPAAWNQYYKKNRSSDIDTTLKMASDLIKLKVLEKQILLY